MEIKDLINELINEGVLKTPKIIEAFRKIDRKNFVPESLKEDAYLNQPLEIGFGQTISQPLTVAFMLELLDVREGNNVLDVGSGSGWTSSLLAYLIGKRPKIKNKRPFVVAIERIPELCEFGYKNASKYFVCRIIKEDKDFEENEAQIYFYCGDAWQGFPLVGKNFFDRILASASGSELPDAWKLQTKIGGKIVMPIGTSIFLFIKRSKNNFEKKEFPGFSFVPLVRNSYD